MAVPTVGFPISTSASVSAVVSEVVINVDSSLSLRDIMVNGKEYVPSVFVCPNDGVFISLKSVPDGKQLQTIIDGDAAQDLTSYSVRIYDVTDMRVVVSLSLVGDGSTSTDSTLPGFRPSGDKPFTPLEPEKPDVPTIPSEPENPDTPGSDEPYTPLLPPAGWVKNFARFIPLGAGALLLYLAFFWKRKVYRILNAHAKKHGEKPEKEHLKEIADAIIKLVRDEGKHPEWKKNSDVAKRLSADIVSVLDEMNYPKIVPREALVIEILEKARGKINRHRL